MFDIVASMERDSREAGNVQRSSLQVDLALRNAGFVGLALSLTGRTDSGRI